MLADQDENAKAKWEAVQAESPESKISYYGFYFALCSMQQQGLDGLPYVDAKTFFGWRYAGFKVKKGEESKIEGVTWIKAIKEKEGEDDEMNLYPKRYALFHRSQVEPIK